MCDKQQTAGWRANLHIISSLHQPLDRIVVLFPPKPHEMIQATYSSRRTRNTCDFTCKHTETLQQNKHVRKSLICVIYPLLLTDLRATYGLIATHKISKQAVPVVFAPDWEKPEINHHKQTGGQREHGPVAWPECGQCGGVGNIVCHVWVALDLLECQQRGCGQCSE